MASTSPAWRGSKTAAGNGYGPSGTPTRTSAPPGDREDRRDGDHELPVDAADAVDEVRQRRADRQRADEHPERRAATLAKPRRHQLQRRRVDGREEEAGRDPQRDRRPRPVARRATARWRTAAPSEPAKMTRRGGTTSASVSADESSAPATNPSCTAIVSHAPALVDRAPLLAELRDHRRCREPRRHREHERERSSPSARPAPGRQGRRARALRTRSGRLHHPSIPVVRAARSTRAPCRRGRRVPSRVVIVVRAS